MSEKDLRALGGLILLIIAILFITNGQENPTIEYILLGLGAFFVGAGVWQKLNGDK